MLKNLSNIFKTIDKFGEPIQFKANRRVTYTTIPGALITLLIYMFIMIYGFSKFTIMWKREDTLHQSTTVES